MWWVILACSNASSATACLLSHAGDGCKCNQRNHQQEEGSMVGLRISEVLDLVIDADGKRARRTGNVAANHKHHAKFADRVCKAKNGRRKQRSSGKGQQNSVERAKGRGPQQAGSIQNFWSNPQKTRGDRLHSKGQAVDHGTDDQPFEGEGQRMSGEMNPETAKGRSRSEQYQQIEAKYGRGKN